MSSSSPSISARHVSKKFARSLKRAMIYGLTDVAKLALVPGRHRSDGWQARVTDAAQGSPDREAALHDGLRPSEFWALRDVSFEVSRGECLGVIGHNGAGKSTLFSVLSGIYGPTTGAVEIRGRLQALIALGAGFHPMLSGRENIFINAAILGMNTREIEVVLEDIIDFSEIRDFIDMPVKNYSSGMLVRLGFSVAIHMKPDVLLVDEVLAVGDLAFRNKSFEKMMHLVNSGIPVVFVSHSMRAVETICSRTLWLDHGSVRMHGETPDVVAAYIEVMDRVPAGPGADSPGDASLYPIRITRVETAGRGGGACARFASGEDILVRLHYACTDAVEHPYFHFTLSRPGQDNTPFASFNMHDDAAAKARAPGTGVVTCRVRALNLAPGEYEIRCGVLRSPSSTTGQKHYQEMFVGARFYVDAEPGAIGRPGLLKSMAPTLPPVLVDHTWDVVTEAGKSP